MATLRGYPCPFGSRVWGKSASFPNNREAVERTLEEEFTVLNGAKE
jgi:hypothetical protein